MLNNVKSFKIWENNNDTPLNASNLSKLIDFQASKKFIHLGSDESYIEDWADVVINSSIFPAQPEDSYLNKIVYNKHTDSKLAKKAVFDVAADEKKWVPDRNTNTFQMINKVLMINGGVQISMNYIDKTSGKRVYLNFDLGDEEQTLSFDDQLLQTEGLTDFYPSTVYAIYLMHNWTHGDRAYLKIVRQADESKNFWKTQSVSNVSPTGYDVIAYRKIGGFKTDVNRQIVEETIWDLFTYKKETTVDSLKIYDNGLARSLYATDISIKNESSLFTASTIESALDETRYLVDGMRNQFYTNRRFGVNVRYTPFVKSPDGTLTEAGVNALTIMISPGIIDVFGTQKDIDNQIFLNQTGVGLRIRDNTGKSGHDGSVMFNQTEEVTLGQGIGQLQPGVWRILLDSTSQIDSGNIYLVHEQAPYQPTLDLKTFAWFDENMNRCIGKFKVKESSVEGIYYVEKMSVTDTYDQNAVPNSIHIHHGTLVPDGLILADGKWHDVMGIDRDSYDTYQTLVSQRGLDWGNSWYEETPNLLDRFLKMPPSEFLYMNTAENFVLPIGDGSPSGGSDDCGREGGTDSHSHSFPHAHGSGTLNIYPSGQHSGKHNITFLGDTTFVNVDPLGEGEGGTAVSTADHTHNTTVNGGEHSHPTDVIGGEVERIEGNESITSATNVLPPYKEVLICIKK